MSIPGIEGFAPFAPPTITPTTPTSPVKASSGVDFAQMLSTGIERLEGLHDRADNLAVQAATGDLTQIHDYTITATEAAVSTQLTTAVRNKALEAFQEIMRIQL
ncbi:flagellar hook-basal body complex protein FliE [Nocardioides pakistanensis]